MKFDNLESKIRKELNERHINPKENSWDRLDAMLTLAEEKKPKSNYKWLFLAASLVGVLFVVSVLIRNNQEQLELNTTVVTEQNKVQEPTESTEEKVTAPRPNNIKPERTYLASETTALKVKKESKKENENTVQETSLSPKILNAPKENHTSANQLVTENTIDQLLASVHNSSGNEVTFPSINVNAKKLLDQVNEPPSLTFKDKALMTLAENYKNVQTAIANRNQ